MGFKDHLATDLNVFLNADELADMHDIDGQQINCVLDSDETNKQKVQDGVYEDVVMLFVSSSALPDRPIPMQHMRIDGNLYLVQKCVVNMGMLEITLEANEA